MCNLSGYVEEKGIEKGRQTKKEYYGQAEKQIKEKHYFEA